MHEPANLKSRLISVLIDTLIFGFFFILCAALGMYGLRGVLDSQVSIAIVLLSLLLRGVLSLYSVYFYSEAGRTPGMLLAKIEIIRLDHIERPTFKQAFVRELPNLLIQWFAIIGAIVCLAMILQNGPASGPLNVHAIPGYREMTTRLEVVNTWGIILALINSLPIFFTAARRSYSDVWAGTLVIPVRTAGA